MELFQYRDLDRNIDEIIEIYQRINQQIVDWLLNDPLSLSQFLWLNNNLIDRECRSQRLISRHSSPYKCMQCIIFDRLLSHNIDETTYPLIKIEYGKYANKYIKVEHFEAVQPKIDLKAKAILVDKFTNIFLTNLYLKRVIDNGLRQLLAGFICGADGYILYETSDFNSLPELTNRYLTNDLHSNVQIIKRLLIQLFALLMRLKETQLSIFQINEYTFNFLLKPINYSYDGQNINDNITLLLNLNNVCAFSINDTRLYTENKLAATFSGPFEMRKVNYKYLTCDETCQHLSRCIYYFEDLETNYQISQLNLSAYRNLNSDLSFDAYMFMLTLMKDPIIYQTILNDIYLSNLWNELWIGDEQTLILNELNYIKKIEEIEPILMTYKLRCDIIEYVWNKLKGN